MTEEQYREIMAALEDMQTTLDAVDLRTERIEQAVIGDVRDGHVAPGESPTYIRPHILVMRDRDAGEESVAHVERGNALLVFRNADEVEKFRELTGKYEGFAAIPVDEVEIARTCVRHGLERICMPEPWTGTNAVEFFDADDFVRMLKDSAVEE